MAHDIAQIDGNPKAALESYILNLERHYYPWYSKATTRDYYAWFVAQAVLLVSGFATAILAALLRKDNFETWSGVRIAIVLLPLVSSLASTFLVQSRIAELEALREKGRETVQRLISEARVDFAAAASHDRFTEIHRELVAEISTLELEQSRGFQRIVPSELRFRPETGARQKGKRHPTEDRATDKKG